VITRLSCLERLHAENLQLTVLPEEIGNLSSLGKAYLNGNCFTRIPASITKLSKLTLLQLDGVRWYTTTSTAARQKQLLSKENFEDFLRDNNLMRWLENNNVVGAQVEIQSF
jgi:Leucine-rich repeat (LRR) protein